MFRGKGLLIVWLCICWALGTMTVCAEEAEYKEATVEVEGFNYPGNIYDGDRNTYSGSNEECVVTVSRSDGIGALYIEFDRLPQKWTLMNPASGASVTCGTNTFLHEFVDVATLFEELPETLVMRFDAGTAVTDIYVFSDGEIPEWVQVWQPPCEEADLLLISSHSDDEQLFFSGILPYYAGERGVKVQVAYVVQHFEANNVQNHQRPHEQLDGLWKVGVRNYPVMSEFPDLYAESKDREVAFAQACAVYESVGITYDDFTAYITECLRRFKPLVVVSHDLDGEYGHGTHVLCSKALTESIEYAADMSKYPDSADRYGAWDVEKLYLHLYEENPIVMNFDIPLEKFGGKTAFEVSQEGFACHVSQHWTWFYKWIYGTAERPIKKAADIRSYSPCLYGLYYTQVGLDSEGGDFLENIETYEERALAAEREAEAKRVAEEAEAAKAAEEAAKAQEEQERLKQQAEAEAAAARNEEAMSTEKVNASVVTGIGAVVLIVLGGLGVWISRRGRRKQKLQQ